MQHIKLSECSTVDISIDPISTVYFYKNRVFRVIDDKYQKQVIQMFECGLMNDLIKKNIFVKTWIANIQIENFDFVLEHEKINYWNYPHEWSFDMLKDAGLCVLSVNKIANKYGYELIDPHAHNVVFNMNKPQYIDFGSLSKIEPRKHSGWRGYDIFLNHFYEPLYLWSKGYFDTARNIFLMTHYFNEEEFFKIKYHFLTLFFRRYLFKAIYSIRRVSLTSNCTIKEKIHNPILKWIALFIRRMMKNQFNANKLEKKIKKLKHPLGKTTWSEYHNNIEPQTNKRFIRIKDIINSLEDAESLVELASNQGKFAEMILSHTHIEKIVSTDYDIKLVNIMYLKNKDRSNLLPLILDIFKENARGGVAPMYARIKSDIVLALAVTHHLILTQKAPIDYIFKTMKKFTNKYIVVEFMPIGLFAGDIDKTPKVPEFYTLSWFKDNFMKYFDLILDEKLEINRHVFVGKIKK